MIYIKIFNFRVQYISKGEQLNETIAMHFAYILDNWNYNDFINRK